MSSPTSNLIGRTGKYRLCRTTATHLTAEKKTALLQIALTGSSPLVSMGSNAASHEQDPKRQALAEAFGMTTTNKAAESAFPVDSAHLNHPYLPWSPGGTRTAGRRNA